MKFSDSKLQGQMRTKPSVIGELPNLNEIPRQRLNMLATGLSHRLGHVFFRWLDRDIDTDRELNGPRLMLILVLAKHSEMAMSEAAELLDVTPRAITRLVDGLEADGFAERRASELDKRVVMVHVTEKGQEVAQRLTPSHEKKAAGVFSVFTDEELRTFINLSHRLIVQLKNGPDEDAK